MTRSHLAVLAVLAAMGSGCSPYQADGEPCEKTYCSDRGTCSYLDTHVSCACEKGYAGLVCSRCDAGYHRAADQSCVPDEACTAGSCGDHGVCAVVLGQVSCACEPGYAGLDCKTCRGGFHADSEGACVLDEGCFETTCSGGGTCNASTGRPVCTCADGRTGTWCEERTATCEGFTGCGEHGTCDDRDHVVRCLCQPGFGGATCSTCYPGFRATEDGACVLTDTCTPSTCSFVGTCTLSSGVAACACQTGYAGASCGECASGFHRGAGYACVADETCAANNRCAATGKCRETGGRVVCDCDAGYAGEACDKCHPGYHRASNGKCELDVRCNPDTCRSHGACNDDSGVAKCTCEAGFSGNNCETNVDDCVNSACGTGTCVDLVDANACLCTDHTWGQTCP